MQRVTTRLGYEGAPTILEAGGHEPQLWTHLPASTVVRSAGDTTWRIISDSGLDAVDPKTREANATKMLPMVLCEADDIGFEVAPVQMRAKPRRFRVSHACSRTVTSVPDLGRDGRRAIQE